MLGYRIVEIKDGKVKSLFHGTRHSRTIRLDCWVRADVKVVRDGNHGQYYVSGFHFLPTLEEAEQFFAKAFRDKRNRYVIPCKVRGNIRVKLDGKTKRQAWLADEMWISSSVLDTLPMHP